MEEKLKQFLKKVSWPATGQQIIDLWVNTFPDDIETRDTLTDELDFSQKYLTPEQVLNDIRKSQEPLV